MGSILSVNLAVPAVSGAKSVGVTGIDKRPVDTAVSVRAPGARPGSGLVGDQIFDAAGHGGDDQAVYVYAREDYDWWEGRLGRTLSGGMFGENLTTVGVDVNGALIGERWRIGAALLLEVSWVRIPCVTFEARMAEPHWIKRFTREARPGAYLRVVEPGEVRAGDPVTVVDRPERGVSVAEGFRAWTLEPELLLRLLAVDGAPAGLKEKIRRRLDR